jgi:hypothetical protein
MLGREMAGQQTAGLFNAVPIAGGAEVQIEEVTGQCSANGQEQDSGCEQSENGWRIGVGTRRGNQIPRGLPPLLTGSGHLGREFILLDPFPAKNLLKERVSADFTDEAGEQTAGQILGIEVGHAEGVQSNLFLDGRPQAAALTERSQELRQPAEVAVDQHLVHTGFTRNGVDSESSRAGLDEDADHSLKDVGFGFLTISRQGCISDVTGQLHLLSI